MVQNFFFKFYFLDTNKLPHETKNCEIRPHPHGHMHHAWPRASRVHGRVNQGCMAACIKADKGAVNTCTKKAAHM